MTMIIPIMMPRISRLRGGGVNFSELGLSGKIFLVSLLFLMYLMLFGIFLFFVEATFEKDTYGFPSALERFMLGLISLSLLSMLIFAPIIIFQNL